MKRKIYIIEDDSSINRGIELTLGSKEYDFVNFYNLSDVKDIQCADLIILDINLPDGNGLDFLKEIRKYSRKPVLILTANDTEIGEVEGLQLGADDYVTKPFSLMALRLRIEKLLSRSTGDNAYRKYGLDLDFDSFVFKSNGIEFELSKTEIRLLKYLVENEGVILSREKLIDHVWQNQMFVDENALSVAIKRLRDKIDNGEAKLIHTVYGLGYVFRLE
ncbi:response regulator receiver domain protein [Filifactor alocis ATCC 35896]|uniref:Stage 0 sporulation protein A homolog n=1 Tax=Filifactor alocis (strain ATCC 35896 / CCUG 47790 / D40 B5) TaxID=546269 RepID=D6GRJ6_FILAD|nr:response regulator transcription factor [Filifactor alocis]EFE28287.1 response regulator receiver domain protein [Filifactor alocis ATCC 35896]